jgi:hypothetical protein
LYGGKLVARKTVFRIDPGRFIDIQLGRLRPTPELPRLDRMNLSRRRSHPSHIVAPMRRLNSTVATRRNGLANTYPALMVFEK